MALLFGMVEVRSVNRLNTRSLYSLFDQVASPLRLAGLAVTLIIAGNFLDWLDAVYQTQLHVLNPILAGAVTILFCLYLYRVFDFDKEANN